MAARSLFLNGTAKGTSLSTCHDGTSNGFKQAGRGMELYPKASPLQLSRLKCMGSFRLCGFRGQEKETLSIQQVTL